MWKKEHKVIVSDVTAKQVWQVWSEIENWPKWDSSLESCWWIAPYSEFKAGAVLYMKVKGAPKFKIFISEAKPYQTFICYTQFIGARLYSIHELQEGEGALQISLTTTISGPLAWLWR